MTSTGSARSGDQSHGRALGQSQGQTTVAGYLAARLAQLGVDHVFGLPGDFNLALIDELLARSALEWVGSTNELNAAYAADGYARRRGFGAVLTTFGVGELSAINAVAGSYAESVPVLQITGVPATDLMVSGALAHHSLVDGDFGHFRRAYDEVTVATETLSRQAPAEQIDRVLAAMLASSRPGYLSIPSDLVSWPVPAAGLRRPLACPASDPVSLAEFRQAVADRLRRADRVTVLAGHLVRRRNLCDLLDVPATGPLTIATTLGGGSTPAGNVYIGALTPEPATKRAVEECDALVVAGVVFSDITSGLFTHQLDLGRAIVLDLDTATVNGEEFAGVQLADTLAIVVDYAGAAGIPAGSERRTAHVPAPASAPAPGVEAGPPDEDAVGPLTHDQLWTALEAWIPAGTTVLADAGTAYYGAAGMRMAPGCELVGQPIWSSIGYTLPALLGTELAEPGRRPVLLIGDGAAQLTVQELATIVHRRLDVVIIVLNNGGYTIERQIRSPEAVYQDITPWAWTALPAALGMTRPDATVVVDSLDGLGAALAMVSSDSRCPGPALVELRLDRDDAPALLRSIARGLHPEPAHDRPLELPRSA